MPGYEYKVIPAPRKGVRAKGVRGTDMRFAHALQEIMNDLAADGWEYLRTDTLPCEERKGLTGRSTVFQNMLVFRRATPDATGAEAGSDDASTPSGAPLIAPVPLHPDPADAPDQVSWRRRLRAERPDAEKQQDAEQGAEDEDKTPARTEPVVSKPG